ncbi:hypothetical protein GCM10010341_60860 [Streptomyces noursei]|nr:hypothetical protein GCM10010341_60860 [Streptomyces noursei]
MPVQAGLLRAAAVPLEERARISEDQAERAAAGTTAASPRRTPDAATAMPLRSPRSSNG